MQFSARRTLGFLLYSQRNWPIKSRYLTGGWVDSDRRQWQRLILTQMTRSHTSSISSVSHVPIRYFMCKMLVLHFIIGSWLDIRNKRSIEQISSYHLFFNRATSVLFHFSWLLRYLYYLKHYWPGERILLGANGSIGIHGKKFAYNIHSIIY